MFGDVECRKSTIIAFDFVPCLKSCFASHTFLLDIKLLVVPCNGLMLLVRLTFIDEGSRAIEFLIFFFLFLFAVCKFPHTPVF